MSVFKDSNSHIQIAVTLPNAVILNNNFSNLMKMSFENLI